MNPRKAVQLALALASFATAAGMAHAQSPLGIGVSEPSFQVGGPFAPLLQFINVYQQGFYRALTHALEAMRHDPWKLWSLVSLSFAYGVFHAAGPGHGKAVISSYMIASKIELRRGIAISFVSAIIQGIVAVLLVGMAWLVLRGTSITLTKATHAFEITSFVMVIAFGVWLLFRKLRALTRELSFARKADLVTSSGMNLAFEEPGTFFGDAERPKTVLLQSGAVCRDPGHLDGAMACESCGHSHLPDPTSLGGSRMDLKEAWSAIMAVGLRPCSGALLVMTFSMLNGLFFGGALSVFAMSVGTAITVSILASLAVTAKGLAMALSGGNARTSNWIGSGIEIFGALLVISMGLLLLGASLQP
jgi:nickel/cobalt exporter